MQCEKTRLRNQGDKKKEQKDPEQDKRREALKPCLKLPRYVINSHTQNWNRGFPSPLIGACKSRQPFQQVVNLTSGHDNALQQSKTGINEKGYTVSYSWEVRMEKRNGTRVDEATG